MPLKFNNSIKKKPLMIDIERIDKSKEDFPKFIKSEDTDVIDADEERKAGEDLIYFGKKEMNRQKLIHKREDRIASYKKIYLKLEELSICRIIINLICRMEVRLTLK